MSSAGSEEALGALGNAVRASGLVDDRSTGVVLISGGPDSACAAAALAGLAGPSAIHALHVNYGLRDTAARDERACRDLCAKLRIDLHVERPDPAKLRDGNLQAKARDIRYAAAERLRVRTAATWIATGHTRTDQAETMVYRLAVSPGSRALLGLHERTGLVIRPLLELTRDRTRELATVAGLPFCDDESNQDLTFARNAIRAKVMPVLRDLNPAAERNAVETRAEIAEEAELLERVAFEALEAAGAPAGSLAVPAAAVARWQPALRRIALRALAERATGRRVALGRDRAARILALALAPEGGVVELPGGVKAVCESGAIRFESANSFEAAPVPVARSLTLPGRCTIGEWEIRAALHAAPVEPAGPDLATLDASAIAGPLEVRTWRDGDRIRPLGMNGSKTLQDLFTDRHIPRSVRHNVPVVTVGGKVAWVAGVAVSEDFRLGPGTSNVAVLTANRG